MDKISRITQLTVLTYNINFGLSPYHLNKQSILSAIRLSPKSEIILLQETNREWSNFLLSHLLDEYPYHHFYHPVNWEAGGSGILSKYPITDENMLEANSGWFPAGLYTIEVGDISFQVLNVHMRPPLDEETIRNQSLHPVGAVKAFVNSKNDRLKDVQAWFQVMDTQVPTLFAGDFNEAHTGLYSGKTLDWLINEMGFNEVLSELDITDNTWYWPLPLGFQLKAMFDFIGYQQPHFKLIDAGVIQEGDSDHYPVYAAFEINI
eukprot:TRINITY_DN3248_c0_g1_i1.p1 TRINITY_DN3248_c0_g1~~TRINITY_DN3248_c0_g1_i1.p1  ORF type:complete len:263 (+),score=41.88 TRINITY_DN3248_c0_g1_i1:44-832(+)